MKPIRVLHENVVMDPGGIETQLMRIYRNIDREKVQFDFMVHRPYKGAYDDEILSMGGKIYYTAPFNPFFYNEYMNSMINVFKENPYYKIIVVHSELALGPLKAAKKMSVPVRVCFSHNNQNKINLKKFFLEYEKFYLKTYCTDMFAVSEMAARYTFGNEVVNNKQVKIIKNGINIDDFIFDQDKRIIKRKELGLDDRIIVGHIGRFMEQKNHLFLLDVFNEFLKIRKDAHLILIGEGRLENQIRQKISKLGINKNVSILGRRMDIGELMQAMDIFLFPSFYEGFGNVVMEAQAAALPTLISDVLTNEVIYTDYAYKCSLGNEAKEWASKLNDIIDKSVVRKNMRSYVEAAGFDINKTTQWFENFYIDSNYKYL